MFSLFNLSFPIFRTFGIQVRLHIIYIILTLGMITRAYVQNPDHWLEFTLIWVVLLFFIILLHELGHCFAARKVGGDAEQILMWPLGGLAYCEVPPTPRANLITTAGGPFVNVIICNVAGLILLLAGYLPPLNIFSTNQLYYPELYSTLGSSAVPVGYDWHWTKLGSTETVTGPAVVLRDGSKWVIQNQKPIEVEPTKFPTYPDWVLWVARVFWLSWLLLLFNLLPAYPLDGGRLLQAIIWGRTGDPRRAAVIAGYSGFVVAILFTVYSFGFGDPLHFALALFIFFSSYQLIYAETYSEERGSFGYDFSKGYANFDDNEPVQKKPRRLGFFARWRLARLARKTQRDAEQRAKDEARLDQILEKINQQGKDSLTSEEKKFLERVSARYRNRP
ncbi:MAG: site-2 protease family protein [Gemmataceae bacterium]|jgi:Zn-dependent protease|nr:site-2 protease family protein [Gemmataceae bacterium]